MVKNKEAIKIILHELKEVHGGKELIWLDMDGVVVDFVPKATKLAKEMGITFQEFEDQKQYRHVEGFYRDLPLIDGAKEGVHKLIDSGKYEVIFLSAASWGNVSCFSDRRIWVGDNFGDLMYKKMDLSFHKGHYMGHYLIDDRTMYGAGEFIGEHIQFGNEEYPNWETILKYLL